MNLPDSGYQPDSEFKIRPDLDTGYRIPDSDIRIRLCKKSELLNTLQPRYNAELGVMLLKWKASAKTG